MMTMANTTRVGAISDDAHLPSLDAVRTRPAFLGDPGRSVAAAAPDSGSVDMPTPCHKGRIALRVWTRVWIAGTAAVGGPEPTHRNHCGARNTEVMIVR